MDKKKIIYIVLFILACSFLAYAIYFVFFKKAGPATEPTDTGTTPGTFPSIDGGTIPTPGTPGTSLPTTPDRPQEPGIPIIDSATEIINLQGDVTPKTDKISQVTDLNTSNVKYSQGSAKFYNNQDGKFYTLDKDGNIKLLSDKVFYNVEKMTWSPTQNEGIIEYPDGSNIYYNFDDNKQVTLPKHWQEFDFSANGGQIISKSMAELTDNRWLITSDPTGNNIELIAQMGENSDKVIVDWSPNNQVIALSATGDPAGNNQEILLIGLNNENYAALTVSGRGLETQWSPEGNKLLHSVYNAENNYKPELWITDATPDTVGQNRKPLGLNTWASKCTMASERFVYCGVPTELRDGAGFAPEVANYTPDNLYKIDLLTGTKVNIALETAHTINDIFTSEDGKTLYFTDKNKDGIFKIDI